jgi:hypothetical protein
MNNESIIKQLYNLTIRNNESSPLEINDIKEEFGLDTNSMISYLPNNWIGESLIISIAKEYISDLKFPQIKTLGFHFENPKLIHIYQPIKGDKITDNLEMSIQWSGSCSTSYKCDNIYDKSLYFKWSGGLGIMKGYRPNNLGDFISLERLNTKLLKLLFNVDLDNYQNSEAFDNKYPNSLKNIEINLQCQ